MEYSAMDQYWIWLSSIEGLGVKRFYQLLSEYEDPRTVWDNVGSDMEFLGKRAYSNLVAAKTEKYLFWLFDMLERKDIHAVSRLSDYYPPMLTNIFDPPPVLYVRGNPDLRHERVFAIVGTRTPTYDGRRAAREIARGLGRSGVTVISGMARGIDTSAHEGCLEAGAPTVGVLGCGVDVIYPPENDKLYQQTIESGGSIISEYMPGTQPLGQHFPARNRIISGMCPGTMVVEAGERSGAMITASNALDQNRDVFVVPGSIYSKMSIATNKLMLDGAYIALSEWEILEHYGWAERPSQSEAPSRALVLTDEERLVVEPLQSETQTFDELSQITKFHASRLNSLLTMLELRGIIDKVPGGAYRAKR